MNGDTRKVSKKVLADHKKVKPQVLLPPLLQYPGNISPVRWVDQGLPDIVWISLLHHVVGFNKGVEIVLLAAKLGVQLQVGEKKSLFASISTYELLGEEQKQSLRSRLEIAGALALLKTAIEPLVTCYPECPLRFLFSEDEISTSFQEQDIALMKKIVACLFDKRSREAVLAQLTAVYIAGRTGVVLIPPGLGMDNIEEVVKYPETDESRKIAASVCAMSVMLLEGMDPNAPKSSWPSYFWNRGLEINGCAPNE
jgi:hypothetical protein